MRQERRRKWNRPLVSPLTWAEDQRTPGTPVGVLEHKAHETGETRLEGVVRRDVGHTRPCPDRQQGIHLQWASDSVGGEGSCSRGWAWNPVCRLTSYSGTEGSTDSVRVRGSRGTPMVHYPGPLVYHLGEDLVSLSANPTPSTLSRVRLSSTLVPTPFPDLSPLSSSAAPVPESSGVGEGRKDGPDKTRGVGDC